MRNCLMLLGWAPSGDREIVPWEVVEEESRLEAVNPSPAFFDERKLRAFNGEYIRALSVEEFVEACQPWLTGSAVTVAGRPAQPAGQNGQAPGAAPLPAPPWDPADYDPKVF